MADMMMPSARWIAAALRAATETLMRELAAPSATMPAWERDQWRIAAAVAAMHGISPLLAGSLRWQGPPEWVAFLAEQREHTRIRHVRISELLASIDAIAQTRGLRVAALKGAALHAGGYYSAGERPMSDVDLLVHPEDKRLATHAIESLGYRFSCETIKHLVFVPVAGKAAPRIGEHAENPIKIELHAAIVEQLPRIVSQLTDRILPDTAGLTYYRTHAALMGHLLLHAAGALAFRSLRALHLQDLARVAARMGRRDWHELISLREEGRFWWAFAPLMLLERYFPASVPDIVLDAAEDDCPWLLRALSRRRALTDVSLSDPAIHAFPGIEWCRSRAEMFAHARARVVPDAQVLAMRLRFGEHQSLGADDPWVHQSQARRILRWLLRRPARVETMSSVRAALAMDWRIGADG